VQYYYIIYFISTEYYFLYIGLFLLTSLMLQCNCKDENIMMMMMIIIIIIIIALTTTAQQLKQCC